MSLLPSQLGFGVSGAHGTALVPARETAALVQQAFAGGVRVFDTAPAYGAGEAEKRLGRALRSLPRSEIFVTTKAGVTSTGLARRIRDFSPAAIERSVRASLSRLGAGGVDGLILHGPAPDELTPALLQRLEALRSAGAFKHLGVAGRDVELDAALDTGRFALLMAPAHPFIGEEARARLMKARSAGIAVMGIEAAGDGPAPLRWPRRPADLYPALRALRHRQPPAPRAQMPGALADPLREGLADCVVMTTIRRLHLEANIGALVRRD
ncbi:MAG: aldo/keto reductase [Glycocaulis sp.]